MGVIESDLTLPLPFFDHRNPSQLFIAHLSLADMGDLQLAVGRVSAVCTAHAPEPVPLHAFE